MFWMRGRSLHAKRVYISVANASRHLITIFVDQMEFDKTKWSCPWNSDQNCREVVGSGVVGSGGRGGRSWGVGGGRGQGDRVGGQEVVGVRRVGGDGGQGCRGLWGQG